MADKSVVLDIVFGMTKNPEDLKDFLGGLSIKAFRVYHQMVRLGTLYPTRKEFNEWAFAHPSDFFAFCKEVYEVVPKEKEDYEVLLPITRFLWSVSLDINTDIIETLFSK